MTDQQEQSTRTLCVIIYSQSVENPIFHLLIDHKFSRVEMVEYYPHFWCFDLEYVYLTDTYFPLYFTPTSGETVILDLSFTKDQPFVFIDISGNGTIAPFTQFSQFFEKVISKKKISFSFRQDDPVRSLKEFIVSFNEDYFLWALIYISLQPWTTVFKYEEKLSSMLLSLVVPFLSNNLFIQVKREADFSSFSPIGNSSDIFKRQKIYVRQFQKYNTSRKYSDVFLTMIKIQLGDPFAYLFSLLLDFNKEFPVSSYIPPLYSQNYRYIDELNFLVEHQYKKISNVNNNRRLSELGSLFTIIFSMINRHFPYNINRILKEIEGKFDLSALDVILRLRMYESDIVDEVSLAKLRELVPNIPIITAESLIPLEWIPALTKYFSIDKSLKMRLVLNSMNFSIPRHIYNSFFCITENGAIVMRDKFTSDCILQPGTIIQPDSIIGDETLIMTCSIAMDNSVLDNNAYVPPISIVVPEKPSIDPTCSISKTSDVSKGVSIHSESVVHTGACLSDGCVVGSRCIVGENAIVGTAAYILPGQDVPRGFRVPSGFKFSKKVIEFARSIPDVIQLKGSKFMKQKSGILDVYALTVFNDIDYVPIFKSYVEKMRDFPSELGRQIARNVVAIPKLTNFFKLLSDMFERRIFLLAIAFWEERRDNSNYRQWDEVIRTATTLQSANFKVTYIDVSHVDMRDIIAGICQNVELLRKNGVTFDVLDVMRKATIDACKEYMARITTDQTLKNSTNSQVVLDIMHLFNNC